jgi:hypothetical protein
MVGFLERMIMTWRMWSNAVIAGRIIKVKAFDCVGDYVEPAILLKKSMDALVNYLTISVAIVEKTHVRG